LAGSDAVRSSGSDACRLTAGPSEILLTTEDCAQAASQAAARMTATSRTTFRPVLNATQEVLAQPMVNMLHPQLAPQPKPKSNAA
jgi:hypothetical protein